MSNGVSARDTTLTGFSSVIMADEFDVTSVHKYETLRQ
jgi:hypothetical protein